MNAFDIKSTKMDVLSISLHTSDLFDLEDVLVKLGKKFQESGVVPFVLDVQEFDYPESLDLAALVSLFSRHGMQILGLKHSNERWAAVAMKYHLLFCLSHSENVKELGQVEVQKTEDGQKARKTVLITSPVRTGQQVYAEDGDLIVTGAVNQGAELIADGNMHIYAPMRGRALAAPKVILLPAYLSTPCRRSWFLSRGFTVILNRICRTICTSSRYRYCCRITDWLSVQLAQSNCLIF